MAARHPLAEALHKIRGKKYATTDELIATLEWAQLEVEKLWDRGDVGYDNPACATPGCNYRRYPASKHCMYHVTGNDTFASRLRAATKRESQGPQLPLAPGREPPG